MPELPEAIIHAIYRKYFSMYVLPEIHRPRRAQESPLLSMLIMLQNALSRANMYTVGALDVTDVSSLDRKAIYAELATKCMRVNISVIKRRLLLLAQHDSQHLHRYHEPAFDMPGTLMYDRGSRQYTISYRPQRYDLINPRVYHVDPEGTSVRAGWGALGG
jgi:hypothetical protein